MIAHLLQTKQYPSNRTSKRNAHARRRTRAQNLPRLGGIPPILVEKSRNNVARTHGIMHARPLLAHRQARRNRQRQPNTLDKQRRRAQKPLHHEPRNDALHLRDARARGIRRKALDEAGSGKGKRSAKQNIQDVVEWAESAPALPLGAAALGTPAAEVLVEIKGRGAVPQFDVAEPLGHDVEEGSVEPDGGAHEGDDNPRLACVVGFCDFAPPFAAATA